MVWKIGILYRSFHPLAISFSLKESLYTSSCHQLINYAITFQNSEFQNSPTGGFQLLISYILFRESYVIDSNFPEATVVAASNYCRNPDNDSHGPWCFTVNGGDSAYCGIPTCPGKPNYVTSPPVQLSS